MSTADPGSLSRTARVLLTLPLSPRFSPSFAVTHPGWENAGQVSTALAIVRSLGQDCTEEFAYTHSLTAWKQLADFQIGVVSACAQPRCALCSKLPPTQVEVFAKDDEDEEKNVVPSDHPMPSWLPDEVVNFWQRYKQGVTEQLKRYLKSAGYPQDRSAHQHREIMS